jgi:hypothetical protein
MGNIELDFINSLWFGLYHQNCKQMNIIKILKGIYIKAREKGGIWFLVKQVFSLERWVIMQRDIGKPIVEIQMEGSFQIRIAKIEDLHLFEEMSKKVYIDVESFANRLKSGQTCYIALNKNKIIYFVWISSVDVPKTVTSHFIKLKPRDVCMYHALCLPDYRGKRLHSSIMSIRLNDLRKKSIDKAYVDCRVNNTFQIKTFSKHGFVPLKKVFVLTIAGKRLYYSLKRHDLLIELADSCGLP